MRHTEAEVLSKLKRKHDVRVTTEQTYSKTKDCLYNGTIIVKSDFDPTKIFDLGNKSWGCIDYLVNILHYRLVFYSHVKQISIL